MLQLYNLHVLGPQARCYRVERGRKPERIEGFEDCIIVFNRVSCGRKHRQWSVLPKNIVLKVCETPSIKEPAVSYNNNQEIIDFKNLQNIVFEWKMPRHNKNFKIFTTKKYKLFTTTKKCKLCLIIIMEKIMKFKDL